MTAEINTENLKLDWDSGICLRPLATKYGISPATAKKYLNGIGVNTSKKLCFTKEVWSIIQNINIVLKEYETKLTVRQLFYQLASRHIVPLTQDGYKSVQSACMKGRKYGYVDWDSIEDRTRQPHTPLMFDDLSEYMSTLKSAYRKDIWYNQPAYFEVWLEKNALYGVINPITQKYGITLQVLTGYSSITAIYDGVERFKAHRKYLTNCFPVNEEPEKYLSKGTILYLGDHDATGLDIDRSVRDAILKDHNCNFINVERIGLLYEHIEKYNILPNPEKPTDTRTKNYEFDKQAELDALPPKVLSKIVEDAIISRLDIDAYNECKRVEQEELNTLLSSLSHVQFSKGE